MKPVISLSEELKVGLLPSPPKISESSGVLFKNKYTWMLPRDYNSVSSGET